jgi:UDP-glucose 4-epimerase
MDGMRRLVAGRDFVFHFAYASTPASSLASPQTERDANIAPSETVIKACLAEGVRKLVFPSTGSLYGPWKGRPFRETDPVSPVTPYGASKLAVENLIIAAGRRGLDYTILRPGSAYGPGQDPRSSLGVVTAFLFRCLAGEPLRIYGSGDVRRDFTFAGDIVRCAVEAMDRAAGGIIQVSSGIGTSVLEVADMCARITGISVPQQFLAERPSDRHDIILDNGLAKEVFGSSPTPLREGMEKTLAWLKSGPIAPPTAGRGARLPSGAS